MTLPRDGSASMESAYPPPSGLTKSEHMDIRATALELAIRTSEGTPPHDTEGNRVHRPPTPAAALREHHKVILEVADAYADYIRDGGNTQ